MMTGIECPYCNKPMRLIMGNPVSTYWICKKCKKEFEYHVFWETFTAEAPAQEKLLKELDKEE
jgi:DNA-directed RNA polymerase subunit RPC12/RpoP